MSEATLPTAEELIGRTLDGRFRLESVLGAGAVGTVFVAKDERLGRDVAVKTLQGSALETHDAMARFEREAKVASRLSHENAVQVFDYGHDGDIPYLVMALVRGAPLSEHLSPHIALMPFDRVVNIAEQIAGVLEAADCIRLVHRDLKPANIFLEDAPRQDNVKVGDFGLAFMLGQDEDGIGRITAKGLVAGTPEYMSPEQADGGDIGPPSDVYSFGCVLFELLIGDPPFKGTPLQMLVQHRTAAPPKIAEKRTDIPRRVARFIQRMLAKNPMVRPTASDCATFFMRLRRRRFLHRWLQRRQIEESTGSTA